MQLKYGTYSWAVNSVIVKTALRPNNNSAGILQTFTNRATVTGSLLASLGATNPQNELSLAQASMQLALADPYKDLILYDDNGVATATVLLNAGSISGVKLVDGPRFEGDKNQGEYAVQRQFSFSMEVEFVAPLLLTNLVSFNEAISFSGGQPVRMMARAVNRSPIDQVVWPYTEFEAVQTGTAVGLLDWPFGGPNVGPGLAFPASTLRKAPKVDGSGPDRVGVSTYKNFVIRYTAEYASPLPLIAAPRLWT